MLSQEDARDKNREEYNQSADAYDLWCKTNKIMQHYCYYSTYAEMQKQGLDAKTVLEVGCGPCPIG